MKLKRKTGKNKQVQNIIFPSNEVKIRLDIENKKRNRSILNIMIEKSKKPRNFALKL